MAANKYVGVYHPDTIIRDPKAMATFCLFFDEIHLISPSDDSKDPTTTYKNLPDEFRISIFSIIGKPSEEETERMLDFYKFVSDIKPLLKEVVYYHPHLLNISVSQITEKLLDGKLTHNELFEFILGETAELKATRNFDQAHPDIKDDMVFKAASTSLKLAKNNGWILIGDDEETPMPILSKKNKSVRQLTSILAEECIKIVLPECLAISPEQILEARDKLKEQLIPFRMTMQKMSSRLRELVKETQPSVPMIVRHLPLEKLV